MTATSKKEVIVWGWFDDGGVWQPYKSLVSNYIEQEYQSSQMMAVSHVIRLEIIDPEYQRYTVYLNQMEQQNIYTGSRRPLERMVFKSPSPFAEGILWEWMGDSGQWRGYCPDAAELLENAYSRKCSKADLSSCGLPYIIDFNHLQQINKNTNKIRQIQRTQLNPVYMSNLLTEFVGQDAAASHGSLPLTTEKQHINSSFSASNHVLQRFTSIVTKPQNEECPICFEKMTDSSGYDSSDSTVIQLSKCKHQFHNACLLSMYQAGFKGDFLQCPVCKCIYGKKIGNCPPGTIEVKTLPTSLPGYDQCGSIVITYNIHDGLQGPEHPNPGKPYSAHGFPRSGYLPDNEQGRKVAHLLEEAWRRRLTFTIGTSVTTGKPDSVVWNEIHHKTEITNQSGHGYPDLNYLDNVLKELEAQGVVDEGRHISV